MNNTRANLNIQKLDLPKKEAGAIVEAAFLNGIFQEIETAVNALIDAQQTIEGVAERRVNALIQEDAYIKELSDKTFKIIDEKIQAYDIRNEELWTFKEKNIDLLSEAINYTYTTLQDKIVNLPDDEEFISLVALKAVEYLSAGLDDTIKEQHRKMMREEKFDFDFIEVGELPPVIRPDITGVTFKLTVEQKLKEGSTTEYETVFDKSDFDELYKHSRENGYLIVPDLKNNFDENVTVEIISGKLGLIIWGAGSETKYNPYPKVYMLKKDGVTRDNYSSHYKTNFLYFNTTNIPPVTQPMFPPYVGNTTVSTSKSNNDSPFKYNIIYKCTLVDLNKFENWKNTTYLIHKFNIKEFSTILTVTELGQLTAKTSAALKEAIIAKNPGVEAVLGVVPTPTTELTSTIPPVTGTYKNSVVVTYTLPPEKIRPTKRGK